MKAYLRSNFFIQSVMFFIGLPMLIWAMSGLPTRSFLKESLSIVTILAFCQMVGQFYWARTNRGAVKSLRMSKLLKYHKIIGYIFVPILLFHPLFLVVPRFFESGITPYEALITLLTTFNQGVVLGIMAWGLMLILGITALFRNKLPMKYTTWRVFHGILAMLFVFVAAWHAMDLGRHVNLAMSILISMLAAGGFLLLLRTYTLNSQRKSARVK